MSWPAKKWPCSCLTWEPQLFHAFPTFYFAVIRVLHLHSLTPDPCPLAFCAETAYVLGNYKTEPCKKPPRLCRQGYACPYYHNSKDRRRSPRKHKYRSFGPKRPAVGGRNVKEGVWLRALLPRLSGRWEAGLELTGPVLKGGTTKGDGMVGALSSSCMRPIHF